ncbi:MAG: hypothetical protein H0U43_00660 [Chthoniobacterales bacterium]|nr:hypothetical protein [Chthoniobacterales bacterium]
MESNRQRKKLWLAILASIFVHLLVAYSLVAFNTAFAPPTPVEDDKPVELTMVDLSATPPPLPSPPRPQFIETDVSKESAEEPAEKTFESNANSIAASKLPATGDVPLPSQQGRELPFMDMETQQSSLAMKGSQAQPAPTPLPPEPSVAPQEQTPKPQPTATPKQTPLPEPSAAPEQLAMLTGTPPPPIRNPAESEPTVAPDSATTPAPVLPRPVPVRPESAYRPQKQETKITGNISNRGQTAANAVATPFGRYQKEISNAIGERWYYYVRAKSDLASLGTAVIAAEVDNKGQMQNMRIVSNNANEAFANICLQSFQEAQIPPIPPELIPTLPGGRMPVEISFTYY